MESPRAQATAVRRRLPFGAEPDGEGGAHFRVWAPDRRVTLEILEGERVAREIPLEAEAEGYFSVAVEGVAPGTRYRYLLDGGRAYPDLASRHQPEGPHGPSAVVDPGAYAWGDEGWAGVPERPGPVLYEMHVGTFTPEGTWGAAARRLPHLRELGVTVVQMMPVNEFSGGFGWGYDGVLPFAPYHAYGHPDDLRAFVDTAHRMGLAVILDVVYNHLGADGNWFPAWSPAWVSRGHTTEWGDAFNYDEPGSEHVRAYVLANARYWIEEFHFDGFRFDATQEIHDDTPDDYILHAIVREARAAAHGRRLLMWGENEPQQRSFVVPQEQGGAGLDGIGNDDYHHVVSVALTGRREGYFRNHHGTPQELISAVKRGFLYQGQWYPWQRKPRGTTTRGLPHRALIHYLENHDQVANRPRGARLHSVAAPGRWRATVALHLLGPQTPLIFQGQEFASSKPFHYFAHNPPDVADQARKGRADFLSQFRDLATPEARARVPEPADPETFRSSRLDWSERDANETVVALHRDLLRLRATDPTFSGEVDAELDGAVLGPAAFVLRWLGPAADPSADRLLLVNLGHDLHLDAAPEPLLAPPEGRSWRLVWSSQDVRYGGPGTPPPDGRSWDLPGGSTLVMEPADADASDPLHDPVPYDEEDAPDWAPLVEREWLVTNGLGGYASGTVSGAATRRYHGLLIASHPPPLGRVLTLADLIEEIDTGEGDPIRLGGEERAETLELHGARHLVGFRLEHGLPVWTYQVGERRLDKRVLLVHERNTVVVLYRLLEGDAVDLTLRPMVRLRQHDVPVDRPLEEGYRAEPDGDGLLVRASEDFPELRLRLPSGGAYEADPRVIPEFLYRLEASRGYASVGDTWSPGVWRGRLEPGRELAVVASTDTGDVPSSDRAGALLEEEIRRRDARVADANPALREGRGPVLVLAADQFLVRPLRATRTVGEEERSVIAGYHWFTDWGRDTMISLEGLTLVTGRPGEARRILRTFASRVRDGLIPNLFPEGNEEGLYHTADATLWFFHALERYVEATGDGEIVRELLPVLREIVDAHLAGTRFGIGVDPADGLLRQGAEGYQLTWMDAKVDGWVVTPRRGKAVEINALWYNAVRVLEAWEREEGDAGRATGLAEAAERARASFNERFWIEDRRYLYDVVDGEAGDDDAFRPNQVFAVSLPHPVLEESRWEPVVEAVRERLLTPVGLRSLAPGHPDYRSTYFGDLRTRDAAYHQGTVWSWLIGPFVDAWLRVHPDDLETARGFLDGLLDHVDEFGVGSIAEVFDGDPPHRPRGCIAQAWGVAELLRCLVRTGG